MTEDELKTENDRLRIENLDIKGFQSASDRRVQELVVENDTLKEQLGEEPREKKKPADKDSGDKDLAAKTAALDRKERVFTMAVERGLDPREALGILGGDDLEGQFEALDTLRQAERDATLKANGRAPHQTIQLQMNPMSIEAINALPDEQIKRLDPEMVDDALTKHLWEGRKKNTMRAKLTRSLGGE